MEQKNIIYGILGVIVLCGIVFILYQQQESQPPQDFELEEEDLEESWYYDADPTPVEQGSILQECGQQETSYKRDLCWRFEAFDSQDPEKCLNIESEPDRITCLRTLARDFIAPDVQAKLDECDETYYNDNAGYYACIAPYNAQLKNDKLAVCSQYFSDNRGQQVRCLEEVARELYDRTICDSIPEQNYREHCYWVYDTEVLGQEPEDWPFSQ
jgi:hypothetical protein